MMQRVYIDTSVVGGCFDEEFKEYSLDLFEHFSKATKTAIISDLLLLELEEAPEKVQKKLSGIPQSSIEYVSLTKEAIDLADLYLKEEVVAAKSVSDARHIAIATIVRADVLVSWNFRHIVNLNRIRGYQAINLKNGYQLLEIRSPREVLDEK